MLGAINHALAGLHAGIDRLNQAAGRLARDGAAGDVSVNVLDLTLARHEVLANVTAVRVADETIGTLLDVLA